MAPTEISALEGSVRLPRMVGISRRSVSVPVLMVREEEVSVRAAEPVVIVGPLLPLLPPSELKLRLVSVCANPLRSN